MPRQRIRQPLSVAEECVPNIGIRGRRRRQRNGVLGMIAAGIFATWAGTRPGMLWWMWVVLAVLYSYAMLGLFQAREKT